MTSSHLRKGETYSYKGREVNLRRAFAAIGFIVERDATRNQTVLRQGAYRVRSAKTGAVVYGEFWECTLDDLKAFLDLLRLKEMMHRSPVVARSYTRKLFSRAAE